ncbi:MAG: ATP-binding protein [Synergistetes bacterium]|nr:ATP-binding protein [Synergistota bacterium]MCX8127251.1 ATP-binding protein [Synergistota bacterium]MDW8191863.1 ATP-binding protein [Synergistota bacterium]
MRFWDRKGEIRFLKAYLRSLPNSILFIYGPKSSGKSTLMKEVLKRLTGSRNILYYDFRGKLLRAYRTFSDLLFSVSSFSKEGIEGFPRIDEGLKKDLSEGKVNPFELLEEMLRKFGGKNVIVIDEVQKLKSLYLYDSVEDGRVLEELLNFFVRITKVEHLSHVILMTSDTFFIEELCSKSFLANCVEYFFVDFFSDEIAKDILLYEKLSETESSYVVSWCGGVPWFLERVLAKKKILGVRESVKVLYNAVRGEVLDKLGRLWSGREDLAKKDGEVLVRIVMGSKVDMLLRDRESVERLASSEIVFYDPITGGVRPQTRLHERAIKEVLGL